MVCGDMSFTVFCRSCHQRNRRNLAADIIDRLSEGNEILQIDRGALVYIRAKIGELWSRRSPGVPKC